MRRESHTTVQTVGAVLGYACLTLLFFARPLLGAFRDNYFGTGTDPTESIWFLKWWPHAIHHALNPLFTRLVWAPHGTNLVWGTPIPFPALIAAPITATLGPVAAYNILCLIAPVAAAMAAYLLCRWITGRFWPSILGGVIFGFSPYMVGQMMSHLDLVMIFPIPLAVLAVLRFYAGEIRARTYVIVIAVLMVVQFLCFPEIFASAALFGAIGFGIAIAAMPDHRERLRALIAPTAIASAAALAVLSPYLYAMLASGIPRDTIYSPSVYSADALSLIVPSRFTWIGSFAPTLAITRRFAGYWIEQGACFGVPLLIVAALYCRREWERREVRLLAFAFVAVVVAMLGPFLQIAGVRILPMPWIIAAHAPLIRNALPIRFAMYGYLLLAIIAALWLCSAHISSTIKGVAITAIVLMMLPRLDGGFFTTAVRVPAFFTDNAWRGVLSPDEIIVPLPYERDGNSMLWQVQAAMGFRMASGYTSIVPPEFKRYPAVRLFLGAIDLPEADEQIKAFVAQHEVGAIVLDDACNDFALWRRIIDPIGFAASETRGIRLYKVPVGSLSAYARLNVSDLEARAVARRSDILVGALARWFAGGGKIADASAQSLKSAGLLPPDWRIGSGFSAYRDFAIAPLGAHHVAIILAGSYGALEPLARRYRGSANEIYAHYPEIWRPNASYPAGAPAKFVFEFTPAALEVAAHNLQVQELPEMDPGFWPDARLARRPVQLSTRTNPGDAERGPSR